jgi:hypothetical protein
MSKNSGPNITTPIISKHAGTNDINIAGLPIFLRLLISSDNPDLVNIIINAICLKYEEISISVPSTTFKTDGPIYIPSTIYQTNLGSFIFSNKTPPNIPNVNIINKLKNITVSSLK